MRVVPGFTCAIWLESEKGGGAVRSITHKFE